MSKRVNMKTRHRTDAQIAEHYEQMSDAKLAAEVAASDWERTPTGDPSARTVETSLRLSRRMIEQLKRVAEAEGIPYQRLLKLWITERLDRELAKLEGRALVGSSNVAEIQFTFTSLFRQTARAIACLGKGIGQEDVKYVEVIGGEHRDRKKGA